MRVGLTIFGILPRYVSDSVTDFIPYIALGLVGKGFEELLSDGIGVYRAQ